MATAKSPVEFQPELTEERLRVVAEALLEVRYSTLNEMHSPFDDNYTRESVVFGRQRNMLIGMAQSGQYGWMQLTHAGMDITFYIGGVPCRFFTDDPDKPEKYGFFKRSLTDNLFSPDDQEPVLWRFVIGKSLTGDDEDEASFVGYNAFHEKVCEWEYRPACVPLHSVDRTVPPSVEIEPARVDVREDEQTDTGRKKTGNDE